MNSSSFFGKKFLFLAALMIAGVTCDDYYKDYKVDVQKYQAHPWHGVSSGTDDCKLVNAFIENAQGDHTHYALDQKTGLLKLKFFLPNHLQYPTNFGFIPKTLNEVKDALEIVVLSSRPLQVQSLAEARVIGALEIKQYKLKYHIIIAVSNQDPAYQGFDDVELVKSIIQDVELQFIKAADPSVEFGDLLNAKKAHQIIADGVKLYKKVYGDDKKY